MNAIFLDIDGVLNDQDIMTEKFDKGEIEISLEKLKLLKKIMINTNSVIILSSSWRFGLKKVNNSILPNTNFHKEFLDLFLKHDIKIYDITGNSKGKRIDETRQYLKNNKKIDNYIILDDDPLNDKHQIKTNFYDEGLTSSHVDLAICKLNKSKNKVRSY